MTPFSSVRWAPVQSTRALTDPGSAEDSDPKPKQQRLNRTAGDSEARRARAHWPGPNLSAAYLPSEQPHREAGRHFTSGSAGRGGAWMTRTTAMADTVSVSPDCVVVVQCCETAAPRCCSGCRRFEVGRETRDPLRQRDRSTSGAVQTVRVRVRDGFSSSGEQTRALRVFELLSGAAAANRSGGKRVGTHRCSGAKLQLAG